MADMSLEKPFDLHVYCFMWNADQLQLPNPLRFNMTQVVLRQKPDGIVRYEHEKKCRHL